MKKILGLIFAGLFSYSAYADNLNQQHIFNNWAEAKKLVDAGSDDIKKTNEFNINHGLSIATSWGSEGGSGYIIDLPREKVIKGKNFYLVTYSSVPFVQSDEGAHAQAKSSLDVMIKRKCEPLAVVISWYKVNNCISNDYFETDTKNIFDPVVCEMHGLIDKHSEEPKLYYTLSYGYCPSK